jgi:hypothetical protein
LKQQNWPGVVNAETVGDFMRSTPKGEIIKVFQEDPFETMLSRWIFHIRRWLQVPWVQFISYEELNLKPEQALKKHVEPYLGPSHITVTKPSLCGVKPWKGVVGNWKNYFTPEDEKLFEEKAGLLMKQLGYEI